MTTGKRLLKTTPHVLLTTLSNHGLSHTEVHVRVLAPDVGQHVVPLLGPLGAEGALYVGLLAALEAEVSEHRPPVPVPLAAVRTGELAGKEIRSST